MRIFPLRHPSLGLSIDAKMLGLAEIVRDWRPRMARPWLGQRLRRSVERELPHGLVRPSATEPNVSDVAALARELSALIESRRKMARPVSVALSLPDLCGRMALFEFEKLPAKPAELEALVRWRFQKDLNLSAADARLAYPVFRPAPPRNAAGEPFLALAVAMKQTIIQQYEQACETAGLIPMSVGLTSLQLFDLFRPVMEAAIGEAQECFFLHLSEGSFAFIAIRSGVPVFLRIKPLRNGETNGNGMAQAASSRSASVTEELLATMQFYTDRYAVMPRETAPIARPLFMISRNGDLPTIPEPLEVVVLPIGWKDVPVSKPQASPSLPFTGLPALAGVLET